MADNPFSDFDDGPIGPSLLNVCEWAVVALLFILAVACVVCVACNHWH